MILGTAAINAASFFIALASVSWSAAFALSRWLATRQAAHPADDRLTRLTERLEELELSAEAHAVDIERIGEMQRFLLRSAEIRDEDTRQR